MAKRGRKSKNQTQVYRHGATVLSGITHLKNSYKDESAVFCCSGTTFGEYDDSWAPKTYKRFAINEAIRKLRSADFWVLSDNAIVHDYTQYCPEQTEVLCMHEATEIIRKRCRQAKQIHTVESMPKVRDYDNGFEFYSRGTVLIGAIEMARYMGFKKCFVFGCDCYRLKQQYYYDNRKPVPITEKQFDARKPERGNFPRDVKIYVTTRLRNMIDKLNVIRDSGLWSDLELYCVNSPWSQQQVMRKITVDEFKQIVIENETPKYSKAQKIFADDERVEVFNQAESE